MADYYSDSVFQPEIPAYLLTDKDKEFLAAFRIEIEEARPGESFYLYSEDWCTDAVLVNEESGEETDLCEDDLLNQFQEIIRRSNGELPWISIEKAYTCSKMRPDGYGGSAIFITADDVQYVSTSQWITEQIGELEDNTPTTVPTIAVVMEKGLIQSIVSDSPEKLPPMNVIVIDYDTESSDEGDLVSVPQGEGEEPAQAFAYKTEVTQSGIDLASTMVQIADPQLRPVKCCSCGKMVPQSDAHIFYENEGYGHYIGICCGTNEQVATKS